MCDCTFVLLCYFLWWSKYSMVLEVQYNAREECVLLTELYHSGPCTYLRRSSMLQYSQGKFNMPCWEITHYHYAMKSSWVAIIILSCLYWKRGLGCTWYRILGSPGGSREKCWAWKYRYHTIDCNYSSCINVERFHDDAGTLFYTHIA